MSEMFSILIPSWNNLSYLKLCVESLRKNSSFRHQIIVHVNEGTDGTLEWVQSEKLDYTYSEQNVGVCLAMNMMRSKVKTNYIVFFNDDMYACPHWDDALLEEIKKLPDNRFCFSATSIQRHSLKHTPMIQADYGDSIDNFREEDLLLHYAAFTSIDWHGAICPPNIIHRDIWDLIGGYSVEFSPGLGSDPDLVCKLYYCGIRMTKGVSASRVYHFECKSTGKVKHNKGAAMFLAKWGFTPRVFRMLIYDDGRRYDPRLGGMFNHSPIVRLHLLRSRAKAVLNALVHGTGPLHRFYK